MKKQLDPIVCVGCGARAEAPNLHTLPNGWERLMGDDFCPKCMGEIFESLERERSRANEGF